MVKALKTISLITLGSIVHLKFQIVYHYVSKKCPKTLSSASK